MTDWARKASVGAATAVMAVALVAVAAGQAPDAPLGDSSTLTESNPDVPDTDYTPKAKKLDAWKQVAGAPFGEVAAPDGSPTTFDTDLYAVSFRNTKLGFVGGARCAVPAAPEETSRCDGVEGSPAQGGRVPVIWRFEELKGGAQRWTAMNLGPGGDRPGYVGAIAWISATKAVAVGGTGRYPKRELSADGLTYEQWLARDPAGAGRAWLYEAGAWRELDLTEQLAGGMRGMTALDFSPAPGPEFGAAGALGQIWEWRDGTFAKRLDRDSPASELWNHRLFRYRVRDLRFRSADSVVGVTAGCCADDDLQNFPRVVAYGQIKGKPGQRDSGPHRWYVRKYGGDATDYVDPERARDTRIGGARWCPTRETPEDMNSRSGTLRSLDAIAHDAPFSGSACYPAGIPPATVPQLEERRPLEGQEAATAGDGPVYSARETNTALNQPDSLYSVAGNSWRTDERGTVVDAQARCVTAIGAAGGPEAADERASMFMPSREVNEIGGPGPYLSEKFAPAEADAVAISRTQLTTARIVAGDGTANRKARDLNTEGSACPPNWAIGELRSSRIPGLGAQGLVVATALAKRKGVQVNDWELAGTFLHSETLTSRLPKPEQVAGEPGSIPTVERTDDPGAPLMSHVYLAPSYSLNAVDVVADSGISWAVGDHGAIVTSSDSEGAEKDLAEPPPPQLGAPSDGRLPDASAYDGFADGAVPAEPGTVPEHWDAEREQHGEFGYHDLGPLRVGTVRAVVMSRDGSEGWAFGAGSQAAYFDGRRWSPCHASAALERPRPAACEGIELAGSSIRVATRVPLERDDEPENDDDFELFAVGAGGPLRFRDGHWYREDADQVAGVEFQDATAVAFTAPDNGWVLGDRVGGAVSGQMLYRFLHFDGSRWRSCITGTVDSCDPGGRLPTYPTFGVSLGAAGRGVVSGLVAAGDRIYIFGHRHFGIGSFAGAGADFPFILFREAGDGAWRAENGGYDPGFAGTDGLPTTARTGYVDGLAIIRNGEGEYEGWAAGAFGSPTTQYGPAEQAAPGQTPLLRLTAGGEWQTVGDPGPIAEYADGVAHGGLVGPGAPGKTSASQMLNTPEAGVPAVIGHDNGRLFHLDAESGRFEMPILGRPPAALWNSRPLGSLGAVAPDGRGGHYAAVGAHLFHWTDLPRRMQFTEAPLPARSLLRPITDIAAAPDGTLWASTSSDVLYRYDRRLGWDKVRVPGWEAGTVVTAPAPARAIAVGIDGRGFAVGADGRIARVGPAGVRLDPASGTVCDLGAPVAPCGTSRDLHAVAVASDGSALAGGDRVALLWRPPGGDFRAIARPDVASFTRITAIAMPAPDRAWLATDRGLVYAGQLSEQGWSWEADNLDEHGDPVRLLDAQGKPLPLHSIGVDAASRGYALATGNELLERTGDPAVPWRRVRLAGTGELRSITLGASEGPGALIGGERGLILSRAGGRFHTAQPARFSMTEAVTAVALTPGLAEGEVEAWALVGDNRLLHYTSEQGSPLTEPIETAEPMADAPAPRDGELVFAALGKSDCHPTGRTRCNEMAGLSTFNEVIVERITAELAAAAGEPGAPVAALYTGDAVDSGGYPANAATRALLPGLVADGAPHDIGVNAFAATVYSGAYGPTKLRRFPEFVARPMSERGVPLFAAIGARDLSDVTYCVNFDNCNSTAAEVRVGENLAWRQAMTRMPRPWGGGEAAAGPLEARAVPDGPLSQRTANVKAEDPDGAGPLQAREVPAGGASTHYALDLLEPDGTAVARLVFVDSSLRSLAASDGQQQPAEPDGGQLAWLERVLCFEGATTASGERCTRGPSQQAIVVSNTPTYSYGPGVGTQTATDAALFESTLIRHGANLVVSGRIGWNGLYWATAPGVHEPCPGESYREEPPRGRSQRICGQALDDQLAPGVQPVADALAGPSAPAGQATDLAEQQTEGLESVLPFVVASGAGGRLAGNDAAAGFWHGYTLVRLDPSGDPARTVVEQRPIYDWVALEAQDRKLRPGQRMTLRGFGRVPDGTDNTGSVLPLRLDAIRTAAITHRYDLLLADPERPHVPLEDSNGDYVTVPAKVATVDRQTGALRTGRGGDERTYAIAMLSVGERAATYPLVFEPRRSFAQARARVLLPPLPRAARAPAAQPPVRVADAPAPPPAQPPATPGSPLASQTLQPPQPPTVPSLPASQAPPAPAPPSPPSAGAPPPPPAPPTPPAQPQPLPLSLNAKLQALSLVPSVNPPAPPPVNPAPPAGGAARKEAKQRQAAAAKSEDSSGSEAAENGSDLAQGPSDGGERSAFSKNRPDSFTRARSGGPPVPSFSPLAPPEQPSAWARGAVYGGGTGLAALALAFAWITFGPRPGARGRRREPDLPAPAWSRVRR